MTSTQENSLDTKIELALDQLKRVREDINGLVKKIDDNYVTRREMEEKFVTLRAELNPITKGVWGIVSTVGTILIVAILTLILVK